MKPSVPQTIDFASWGNVAGLWGLVAVVAVCLLCGVGCGALAISGKVGMRRGLAIGCAVLIGGAGVAGWFVRDYLVRFNSLTVSEDGGWSARNGLGVEVARFAPEAPRTVHFRSEYIQGRSSWYRTWVEIEAADGAIVGSVHAHIDNQRDAIEALRAVVAAREGRAP